MDPESKVQSLEAENEELEGKLKKEGISEAVRLAIRAQITANATALASPYAAATNLSKGNTHLRWRLIVQMMLTNCSSAVVLIADR